MRLSNFRHDRTVLQTEKLSQLAVLCAQVTPTQSAIIGLDERSAKSVVLEKRHYQKLAMPDLCVNGNEEFKRVSNACT